jgi:hypothetical protein
LLLGDLAIDRLVVGDEHQALVLARAGQVQAADLVLWLLLGEQQRQAQQQENNREKRAERNDEGEQGEEEDNDEGSGEEEKR